MMPYKAIVRRSTLLSSPVRHQVANSRTRISSTSSPSLSRFLSSVVVESEQEYDENVVNENWKNYPHLFQSIKLRNGVILPNRVLMGSMHTGLEGHSMPNLMSRWFDHKDADSDHSLEKMAVYFQERAIGGVGLMVTGGIAPNYEGWTGPFSSQLTSRTEMIKHKVVTDSVHNIQVPVYGSKNMSEPARICLQILHTGRYAYHPFAVSATDTRSPISPFKARGLSKSGVEKTIKNFVQTAIFAEQAGYDGVEIMGSEGYLLSQFLSPHTNKRNDEYGGSTFANRIRMPLEIVRQVRAATSDKFIIIFRLSLLDLVDGAGLTWDEIIDFTYQLQEAGVTIINSGIGWHESRIPTIATSVPRAAFTFPTKRLRESIAQNEDLFVPFVATNRINNAKTAERVLSNNFSGADMISMARPFLADSQLLKKAATGYENEINTCIGCNQACLDHVFVAKTASCLVNPRACHETEFPLLSIQQSTSSMLSEPLPKDQRLNIGVVGAGPAGCAFTITAAQMGHTVTLYDKDTSIGGQFNMAKSIPGKEEFYETIRYFNTMLNENVNVSNKVTVKLQTEITHEQIYNEKLHDKWIISTGVDPRDPKIPGQDTATNVLSYIDVLKHKKPVGQRVAVIGAGGIGFDVSEFLLHTTNDNKKVKTADDVNVEEFWKEWGIDPQMTHRGGLIPNAPSTTYTPQRSIYLLQRKHGKLGAGLGKTTGWIHRSTLNKSGAVEMIDSVSYDKIDENGYLHVTRTLKDGTKEKRILEVDTIVICAGQVEKNYLAKSNDNNNNNNNVYTIGGAYAAGELDAKRAIDMGTRLAYKIHDQVNVVPGNHVFQSKASVEEQFFKFMKKYS
jgi:2,4-dienoyl-CoA reductase (NADPH2)